MPSIIDEVLVVGHHDPDTDAVCSALGYAAFYTWQTGEKAIACHLDELNRETAWLLTQLGLQPPRAIEDVYLRVGDVMVSDAPTLHADQTLGEGGLLMQRHGLDALPVVDPEGRLTGMLARGMLADRYLAELQLPLRVDLPLAKAKSSGVVVLRTRKTTFAAAQLIQQSLPLTYAMDENLPLVREGDLLTDAFEQLRQYGLAALPAVGNGGMLKGLVLRRHLAGQKRRRVILTDHNHPDQAAPGVSESEILAIIDHHNLGGLRTLTPIRMMVDPLGCTCTLIAELYQRHNAPLTPPLAGAMLGAILSDTVEFRSPTTTHRDRKAAQWLAEKAGEDMGRLARGMFRARLPSPPPPPRWWVHHDWKIYRFGDKEIGIGQTELTEIEKSMPKVELLHDELRKAAKESGLFMAVLVLTDILEEQSFLLVNDEKGLGLAAHVFGVSSNDSGLLVLPGVMSRKKQVVPPLAAALKESSAAT